MVGTTVDDRYRIESEIGRGGMGTVYRAYDLLLERPVAVKVVSAAGLGTEGHTRLLQEARAAARLNHANIVAVYDVGEAVLPGQLESGSFIVMELVDGQTLRDKESLDVQQIVDITIDICQALEAAHEQGIIHRDLKPENVALTSSGSIKLMDFGLARISGKTRLTQQGTFMGTISYLAPEIILGQEASPSSDLYALGVMLYEMSTGRPPFEGGDLTAVLSQHLYAPVVPPSNYNAELPPALDDLTVRLLSKRPEDRPASAREARQMLERISQSRSEPATTQPVISRLVRGRMVGREQEFGEAARLWQEAAVGRGQFLLISGEPGIGKTRMLRELSTYAEISGGRTLFGYCYESERTPYGPIAQMVEASLRDGRLPGLPTAVLADLLTLAPELRLQHPDVPANERLDPESEQQRIFDSIVTWFGALSQNSQVMLLVVDDVHWADSGSLGLLRHLARRLANRRALIVATYREVELDEALPFQEMLNELNRERLTRRIKLARLDREQTRALLATLFSEEITPEFLDGIYHETEGNPFFVEEICKALVESGALYFDGGHWHRPDMDALEIPQGIKVTIQSRLGKLSREEQQVLQNAALLGRDFEYDMLVVASGLDEDVVIAALERAEQAQLVEEVRRSDLVRGAVFSFTHALIHSTLLTSLSTLRRQRLQRRVALNLEASFPKRLNELAPMLGRYFAEAGDGERAVAYLVLAGDDARQVYAYDEAIDVYEQALIFLREFGDHQLTARTLMKLGMTYHSVFQFEQSRRAYEEAFIERRRSTDRLSAEAQKRPDAPHPLRYAFPFPPPTLDTARARDGFSGFVIDLLFSGLVELSKDDELVPDVARSWDVLDNGRRYIFHLRNDVHWSDGTPVTAGDFEFALKRVLAPENEAGLAQMLYDIKGAEAYHNGRTNDASAVGIKAIDPATLEITLERPSGYFLQVISKPTCAPLPRHMFRHVGSAWPKPEELISNGPFLIGAEYSEERMVLVRNQDYHGRFLGNVSQIEIQLIPESEILSAYNADRVDFIFADTGSVEETSRAMQVHPDDYWSSPSGGTLYLFFDVRRPPFDDAKMRKAMALAIDRETIVSRSLKGISLPASGGIVPPAIPGHTPGIATPFDPALARELAAEAGFLNRSDWPVFELLVSDRHNLGQIFDQFAEQWLEYLGLQVGVKVVDFNTAMDREDIDPAPIMVMRWTPDYPDPDTYLRVASWLKNSHWRNTDYEALIDDARRITDRRQRLAMYRQAERLLVEEAPVIPISYGLLHVLVKPWFEPWPSNSQFFVTKDVVMLPH